MIRAVRVGEVGSLTRIAAAGANRVRVLRASVEVPEVGAAVNAAAIRVPLSVVNRPGQLILRYANSKS